MIIETRMRYIYIALLSLSVLFGSPDTSRAASSVTVTPDITNSLKRIEAYLDSIKTMQAEFLQISSNGESASGEILLARPERLRIEYAPPTPVLIVANGKYLSYMDTELKQVNHIPVEDTPAAFLLRKNFSLAGGDLALTNFEQGGNSIRVSMVQTKDPLAGELTLVLTDEPMVLRKWSIVDAQGIVTDLTLINARFDFPISDNRFITSFPELDLGR
jgi:outer membrane lipoprotein-sorting protein